MKKGFTLLELIIVIIILGVLAAFAIPQFTRVVEKARSGEALSLLQTLAQAEIRYGTENNCYTDSLPNLDVEVLGPRYFSIDLSPAVSATPGLAPNERIVTLARDPSRVPIVGGMGSYELNICEDGSVYCTDGNANDCVVLGRIRADGCNPSGGLHGYTQPTPVLGNKVQGTIIE